MAEKTDLVADGFQFGTENDAQLAQAEAVRIRNLEGRLDYKNTNMIYAVYKKAVENRVFKTPVGYAFLKKLQNCLLEAPDMHEELPNIPVQGVYNIRESTAPAVEKVKAVSQARRSQPPKKERITKRISIGANIVLLALVALMFIITYMGSTPTVLNYERALTDKYAYWEQQLSEREQAIREKEKELLIEEDGSYHE